MIPDNEQFQLFAAALSSSDIVGMRASLEVAPNLATAKKIQNWILTNGETFGYAMQQDPGVALEVLERLHGSYPIGRSIRNAALASALVLGASHAGLAKWCVDLGVDPDAMCAPEGTTLLGMLAYADTSSATQVWHGIFDRLLKQSNRPQIVNPAAMLDPVMLGKWLAFMPPPSDPAAWRALNPQADLGEIIKDAAYLAPLPVLKKLILSGFPGNPGSAVFMALIRGNTESAKLLFEHYPDTQVLADYRNEDNETLLHAIGYRESASLLLDASERWPTVKEYEPLLPFLVKIDESVCNRNNRTAAEVAMPSVDVMAWVRASSQATVLQVGSAPLSHSAPNRRI